MANLEGFDADRQQPMQNFEALPKGDYLSFATESLMKPTKSRDGSEYLQFTWKVIDGEHKGRLLWSRLNLKNKSDKAVEIANRELGAICKACKVTRPKDSSELHNIPVMLSVVTESYNDKLTNRVKGYAPANGATAPAEPAAAAPSGKAPWDL